MARAHICETHYASGNRIRTCPGAKKTTTLFSSTITTYIPLEMTTLFNRNTKIKRKHQNVLLRLSQIQITAFAMKSVLRFFPCALNIHSDHICIFGLLHIWRKKIVVIHSLRNNQILLRGVYAGLVFATCLLMDDMDFGIKLGFFSALFVQLMLV